MNKKILELLKAEEEIKEDIIENNIFVKDLTTELKYLIKEGCSQDAIAEIKEKINIFEKQTEYLESLLNNN